MKKVAPLWDVWDTSLSFLGRDETAAAASGRYVVRRYLPYLRFPNHTCPTCTPHRSDPMAHREGRPFPSMPHWALSITSLLEKRKKRAGSSKKGNSLACEKKILSRRNLFSFLQWEWKKRGEIEGWRRKRRNEEVEQKQPLSSLPQIISAPISSFSFLSFHDDVGVVAAASWYLLVSFSCRSIFLI